MLLASQCVRQEVGIEYRRARPEDLPETASVFAIAIDDLNKKHGFFEQPTSTSPPDPQYAFWLKKEPASFWLAEDGHTRSEEHTSELQSLTNLVCRLLLEKKKQRLTP